MLIECPVCRHPILGKPDICTNCGTPPGEMTGWCWVVLFSFILPGAGQLFLGYPLAGSFVMLGSFLLGFNLFFSIFASTVSLPGVFIWGLIWILWAAGWGVRTAYLRRRFIIGSWLLLYLLGLLFFLNFIALFYWVVSLFVFG